MKVVVVFLLAVISLTAVSAIEKNTESLRKALIADRTGAEAGVILSKAEIRRAGQGTLMTRSYQEAGRREIQENQWDSDAEGGTSVVLSNMNSVMAHSDDKAERAAAAEMRNKMGEEQTQKDSEANSLQEKAAQQRRQDQKDAKLLAEKEDEERLKREAKFESEKIAENKKKRDAREEQSAKQEKQFQEQTDKRNAQLKSENDNKQKKRDEELAKKRQRDEDESNASIRRTAWQLEFNKVLKGGDIPFTGAYTYMFWIRPQRVIGGWGQVLHKGQENVQRNPAFWIYPGGLRLHCRSGTRDNWNNGCDPEATLPLNQWTHVSLIHDSWGVRVYFNGVNVCNAQIGGPVQNGGPLYVTDPWHDVAQAELADLRHYPRAVDPSLIGEVVRAKLGI